MKKWSFNLVKNSLRILSSAIIIIGIIGWVNLTKTSIPGPSHIKVGIGETIITPPGPVGFPMAGYDRGNHSSTGIHDELHARSIVVEGANGNTVVLMSVS